MTRQARLWTPWSAVSVVVAAAATMTACAGRGDLRIENDGSDAVVVSFGDERVEITPDGGAAILGYGCTPGDVTVRFSSGRSLILPGPVCPEQRIVVSDDGAEVLPAPPGRS